MTENHEYRDAVRGGRQDSFASAMSQLPPEFINLIDEVESGPAIKQILKLMHGLGYADGARAGADMATEAASQALTDLLTPEKMIEVMASIMAAALTKKPDGDS